MQQAAQHGTPAQSLGRGHLLLPGAHTGLFTPGPPGRGANALVLETSQYVACRVTPTLGPTCLLFDFCL